VLLGTDQARVYAAAAGPLVEWLSGGLLRDEIGGRSLYAFAQRGRTAAALVHAVWKSGETWAMTHVARLLLESARMPVRGFASSWSAAERLLRAACDRGDTEAALLWGSALLDGRAADPNGRERFCAVPTMGQAIPEGVDVLLRGAAAGSVEAVRVLHRRGLLMSVALPRSCSANRRASGEGTVSTSCDPVEEVKDLLRRSREVRTRARAMAGWKEFARATNTIWAFLREIEQAEVYVPDEGSPLWKPHESLIEEAAVYQHEVWQRLYARFQENPASEPRAPKAPDEHRTARPDSPTVGPMVHLDPRLLDVHLIVMDGPTAGHVQRLGMECCIGRHAGANLPLRSARVSRRHASVFRVEGQYWITDLSSTHGTSVNDELLSADPRTLRDGDVITVGDVRLGFCVGDVQ